MMASTYLAPILKQIDIFLSYIDLIFIQFDSWYYHPLNLQPSC